MMKDKISVELCYFINSENKNTPILNFYDDYNRAKQRQETSVLFSL